MVFLGIDTSNYTTSTALYDAESGVLSQQRAMLPVTPGRLGLRQSDAVFLHVKQLPGLLENLLKNSGPISAVGVSARPRDADGSYMPCFLSGEMAARAISASLGVPVYGFSHQAGHIAAVLFGVGDIGLAQKPFLAFHVSGGTTECLLVTPGATHPFEVKIIARTLDLHAGQIIDRVGRLIGLDFPAGPALEKLAASSTRQYAVKPVLKGMDCCLSGLENQCRDLLKRGASASDIAMYCQSAVGATVAMMARAALAAYPGLPFIFAGGVMSNAYIRGIINEYIDARFSPPALSADNAAGIAVLAHLATGDKGESQC